MYADSAVHRRNYGSKSFRGTGRPVPFHYTFIRTVRDHLTLVVMVYVIVIEASAGRSDFIDCASTFRAGEQ